ncbi:hypothetical protein KC19_VG247500 [Ceratodon purpureus]|uniref:Uncharacterized protein n=1 Tax=Ceratodon purpureus TaxID=3225 RepID=A0A8T0HUP6_CERPU|nr:hypothetical protein KC19_VG247500 [Ceratodon purpureus]
MKYIGNNIKERRARIKDKQQEGLEKNKCTVPMGCSIQAWNAIWDSQSDPKKQSKAHKCRVAAEARFKDGRGSHRWGRLGLKGMVARFESEFGRTPTAEEVEYAKFNAYAAW